MHIGGKWKWHEDLGPLGGAVRPHLGAARCPLAPYDVTDPPQVLETHSQASSTVDFMSVQDEGLRRSITQITDMACQYNQRDKHLQPSKPTHDMWAKLLEGGRSHLS